MEVKMREALDLSGGEVSGLFNEPLAIFVYALVVLAVLMPLLVARFRPPVLLENQDHQHDQHHDQEVP
jgi:putative tricarboxylic transport membrane protein